MKYCKKCVMPDTRPGIKFDEDGVCYPCKHYERRKEIIWDKRWKELEELADRYRGCNGDYYDCIIAVSAGKDSHYQVHVFKEKLEMNPLLVMVDNFSWTQTGLHNWRNLLSEFNVEAHVMTLNPSVCRKMFKLALEFYGSPTWYFDRAIYAYPIQTAVKLGIPLIVYGENINYEYGGRLDEESYSAKDQIDNNVVKPIDWDVWLKADPSLSMRDFNPAIYPAPETMEKTDLNPIYLSYFVPWSGYNNMKFARSRGFKTLEDTGEWKRRGYAEQYDQIDTVGYNVHPWFKFVKFGHQRVTDVASLWIREGRMSREEAVKLVNEEDYKLDPRIIADFLEYTGIEGEDFWKTVDTFANKDIVEMKYGVWKLKEPCH